MRDVGNGSASGGSGGGRTAQRVRAIEDVIVFWTPGGRRRFGVICTARRGGGVGTGAGNSKWVVITDLRWGGIVCHTPGPGRRNCIAVRTSSDTE